MAQQEKKLKAPKLQLEASMGSYYVRFHQPVPPAEDKEPVSEFRIETKQTKYLVDAIMWTPHGVVVTAYNKIQIIPLANVMYCRLSL